MDFFIFVNMTGKEFKEYLVESGLFRESMPAYLVDNPITCNRIPSHIKYNFPKQFSYDIRCEYHDKGIIVYFYIGANNLYDSEKLSQLSLPKLIEIMSKFLDTHNEFRVWKSKMFTEYRDSKLDELEIF